MTCAPDGDRFEQERRFLLTRSQVVDFFAAVGSRAELEVYDPARPVSFTRTTYLDSDDLAYFRSCEGPIARRLRIREYALAESLSDVPELSGSCFLELKQNAGDARSKVRLSAPVERMERIIAGVHDDDLRLEGPEQAAALATLERELASQRVAPRLTTWYRRTCLTSEGGRVRVTLDEGLTFCKPQRLGRAGQPVNLTRVVAYGPARILEVKFRGEEPDWLARATASLSAASNFSKFRMGMMAVEQSSSARPASLPRALTPAPALFVPAGQNP
jgi:hypothetical protein